MSSRYLHPIKIGLLALIEIYSEGAVPNDGILPILTFITSHLIDEYITDEARDYQSESLVRMITSITDFERVLYPYIATVGLPGRRLWDFFLLRIWEVDSLDAMHRFFEQRPSLLVKSKEEQRRLAELGQQPPRGVRFSYRSPFGTFVRRCHVEFTRLRFQDACELWREFVKYRQPTETYWKRRNPNIQPLSFDSVLLIGEHEWGIRTKDLINVTYGDMIIKDLDIEGLPVSIDDLDRLLEFQIEHMQSKLLPQLFLSSC
jgi:anaphase-promoting complex subunit 5